MRAVREQFDEIYTKYIIKGGFFESEQYYTLERERYWRSLQLMLAMQSINPNTKVLEIGGC